MNWHDYFTLDEALGVLYWKARPIINRTSKMWNSAHAGKQAGTLTDNGYLVVYVNNKRRRVHNIIWEMIEGPIPEGFEIDHRNGLRADNRRNNMRLSTRTQNNYNHPVRSDNTSGFRGVSWHGQNQNWTVRIKDGDRYRTLGSYATPEEASAIYEAEARRIHGEFYKAPAYV